MEHAFRVGWSSGLTLLTLLWGGLVQAGDPAGQKPLLWAGDAEGGAPYVSMDPDHPGQYVGFEVELRDALQREIGRPIEFKQYSFPKLDSGLHRGDFDFAMNGVEATPDRQERFRLSRPYYVYTLQLVCRRDDRALPVAGRLQEERRGCGHDGQYGRSPVARPEGHRDTRL